MLGGTGLVEAGTYVAILGGTLLAGVISVAGRGGRASILIALVGYVARPPGAAGAARSRTATASISTSSAPRCRLISATLHIRRLFLAIVAISFFWTIGAVLFIQFPPLVKNVLTADKAVASLFLAIFSVGVAIGSVAVNRLLKGEVSARYSTPAVLVMGLFVVAFHCRLRVNWIRRRPTAASTTSATSSTIPATGRCSLSLLGIADLRRHVRGAALRLPHHHRAEERRRRARSRPTTSSIRARWWSAR